MIKLKAPYRHSVIMQLVRAKSHAENEKIGPQWAYRSLHDRLDAIVDTMMFDHDVDFSHIKILQKLRRQALMKSIRC